MKLYRKYRILLAIILVAIVISFMLWLNILFDVNENSNNLFKQHKETGIRSLPQLQYSNNNRSIASPYLFKRARKKAKHILKDLLRSLKLQQTSVRDDHHLKILLEKWIHGDQLYPKHSPDLGLFIQSLAKDRIISADITNKGSQLKILVQLSSGLQAFVKPKRYNFYDVVTGPPYSGYDRHNGEIAAFYLALLLDFRVVPIAVGRSIHVRDELKPVATERFLKSFDSDKMSDCFFGVCYYCKPSRTVCPNEFGYLDSAMILLLPKQYLLASLRHPWQRTYKENIRAMWEQDQQYCKRKVITSVPTSHLLDLIDTSIFDYLIGNADRHHYEIFSDISNSGILLIDNAKSFGDPTRDEKTILAPLYQCCLVKKMTYERLLLWSNSSYPLSKALRSLLRIDSLYPVISQEHLKAVDRRLNIILVTIARCIEELGRNKVLKK